MSASNEPQTSLAAMHGEIGDYVVPSYYEMGRRKENSSGQFVGSKEQIDAKAQSVLKSALSPGAKGSMLPKIDVSPIKAKTKKTKIKQALPPPTPTPTPPTFVTGLTVASENKEPTWTPERRNFKTVTFENAFGKIKVTVLAVLEEETAVILVFKDEDSISFIPKNGETLNLIVSKDNKLNVMYPGFLFTWTDEQQKLMVLVKVPQEDEE